MLIVRQLPFFFSDAQATSPPNPMTAQKAIERQHLMQLSLVEDEEPKPKLTPLMPFEKSQFFDARLNVIPLEFASGAVLRLPQESGREESSRGYSAGLRKSLRRSGLTSHTFKSHGR